MSLADHWAAVEDRWPSRNERIAGLIPAGSSVLDLGAGAQSLRGFLVGCDYTPADIVLRSPDAVLFDMNRNVWPVGRWDVVVLSGVLEYAIKPEAVLWRVRRLGKVAIVTYAHERSRQVRMKPGLFRNSLSEGRFRILAKHTGWQPHKVDVWQPNVMREQAIWRLT